MKVSLEQVKTIAELGGAVTPPESEVDASVIRLIDQDLIAETVSAVVAMPDRDGLVEDLKARIAAGAYRPTADEIVDVMIRRAVADRAR
jgi:anti-sigma28 factor (negative regulator of flagellin synthesis)